MGIPMNHVIHDCVCTESMCKNGILNQNCISKCLKLHEHTVTNMPGTGNTYHLSVKAMDDNDEILNQFLKSVWGKWVFLWMCHSLLSIESLSSICLQLEEHCTYI